MYKEGEKGKKGVAALGRNWLRTRARDWMGHTTSRKQPGPFHRETHNDGKREERVVPIPRRGRPGIKSGRHREPSLPGGLTSTSMSKGNQSTKKKPPFAPER